MMSQFRKHFKIKTILFYISVCPYLVFLILGVVSCVGYAIDKGYVDLYYVISPLSDFFLNAIFENEIPALFLIIFCIAYPIYYLIDKSTNKQLLHKEAQYTSDTKKLDKLFILYILSFVLYFWYAYSCIVGMDVGIFNTHYAYGFDVLTMCLFVTTFIPIFPIVLFFQIIYLCKCFPLLKEKQRNTIKLLITITILLIFIPCALYKIF